MAEIININDGYLKNNNSSEEMLEEISYALNEVREINESHAALSIPYVELSSLGAVASSFIPGFNTVSQTTTYAMDGLYRVANAEAGDVLKVVKSNGNFWGAMKTAAGKSKMAQLTEVSSVTGTSETVAAFNPATLFICAALIVINQKLDTVIETGKAVMSFLETEQQAKIRADLESLFNTMSNFYSLWSNDVALRSYHQQAVDIKRSQKESGSLQRKDQQVVREKQETGHSGEGIDFIK